MKFRNVLAVVIFGGVCAIVGMSVGSAYLEQYDEVIAWRQLAFEIQSTSKMGMSSGVPSEWRGMRPHHLHDVVNPCIPATQLARGAYFQNGCQEGKPNAEYFVTSGFVHKEDRVVANPNF